MDRILEDVKKYKEYMVEMRRYFHRHPELSGQELKTIERISQELGEMGIEHQVIEDGGILAEIRGSASGKTVLLRADVDALPVQESECNLAGPKAVVSENKNAAHLCGHDAHTAMLLGAAKVLQERREEFPGRVLLVFERGEEATYNLVHIMKYIQEHNIEIDTGFGCHVANFLETGKTAVQIGPAFAGYLSFTVRIIGTGGHGSRPDEARNPIDCFAAIAGEINCYRTKYISPFEPFSISIGSVHGGSAENIIPGEVVFSGSCRIFNIETADMIAERLRATVKNMCAEFECTSEIEIPPIMVPVINHRDCAELAKRAIENAVGSEHMVDSEAWMGSESFSMISSLWPSVFISLGIKNDKKGTGAPHHNSMFDIDEEALPIGAAAHVAYATAFLSSSLDPKEDRYAGTIEEFHRSLQMDFGVFD